MKLEKDDEEPSLLTIHEVADRLSVSARTVTRLNITGGIPMPIRLMRSIRWNSREISLWIAAGCPSRQRWQELSKISLD